ncbi:MAG: hypothetical protein KatS3mg015_2527 [Fimbriimonadales bacterium]|nr:MAG: hypothetical protein KatS3mg015_2527 [Fimbriimonadales bacterium]
MARPAHPRLCPREDFLDAGPLQRLSQHGGDEDWLAVVPPPWDAPAWMDTGTSFGVCRVGERELPGGYVVVIGAHA